MSKASTQKKIALVYDAVFPFVKGGAEQRFNELGRRLSEVGYDVHLYGMKCWDGPSVISFEGMTLHGLCKMKPLYTATGRRSISQALWFGVSCLKLFREKFDVMDCCGFPYFSLFSCRLVTWVKRKPLYATWHEVWGKEYWKEYLGAFGSVGYLVEKITVTLPDTIIAASENTAQKIRKTLGRTAGVITVPNGVALSEIRKTSPSDKISDVLYAGRLISNKNVDMLIRSTGILKQTHPDIKVFIAGDGPEREKLEVLSAELKLTENIAFFGFLKKHADIYSLMKSSKTFVLPSTREGFGIVVIEANACGLPVVTIDHKYNAAKDLIINNENGSLCPLSERELAGAIERTLKTRKNSEFYEKYSAQYDWETILIKLKNAYFA